MTSARPTSNSRPRGPRSAATAALALLLAVFGVVVSCLLQGVPAAAADGTSVAVSNVRLVDGSATFTVSVSGLPAGATVQPDRTVVKVGARVLDDAEVQVMSQPKAGHARTAVLVVDTSGSMGVAGITAARAAALAYAARAAADVRIGLVGFSDHPHVLAAPTTERFRLQAGLAQLRPAGETALYDAVTLAVQSAGRGGAVVVLSDGADTVSSANLKQALFAVHESGARVDTIAFRTADAIRGPLDQLARAGGGRVVQAAGAKDLAAAFADAAARLSTQLQVQVPIPAGTRAGAVLSVHVVASAGSWDGRTTLPGSAVPGPSVDSGSPTHALHDNLVGPARWYGSLGVLLTLVFAVLLLVAWLVLRRPDDPAGRRQRALAAYTVTSRPQDDAGGAVVASEASAGGGFVGLSERYVRRRGLSERLTLELDRAGSRLRPAEWLVLQMCSVLAAIAVFSVLTRNVPLGAVLGAVSGWAGTRLYLRLRQSRRARAFAEELPDTLQLVATSLRTGFSLSQALDAAQQDGAEPMASELGRALAAARIGAPLEDELEQVAGRTSSEDWRWAVMAIRIQRSVGGNLAEVLLTTVTTLRERAATRRMARALSAEGRLSAYILIGLPIFVTGFLVGFRRDYLRPLWTTTPGLVMIAACAVLLLVGVFWMRKVVRVEV